MRFDQCSQMLVDHNYTLLRELRDNRHDVSSVKLASGEYVDIKNSYLLLSILFWQPLLKRGILPSKQHIVDTPLFTSKYIADMCTGILRTLSSSDAIMLNVDSRELKKDILHIVNNINRVITTLLGNYPSSVSYRQMAEIINHPEYKEASYVDVDKAMALGTYKVEDELKETYDKAWDKLKDPSTKSWNILYPYCRLGVVKKAQISQIMVRVGLRTDINDRLIPYVIKSNYFGGLADIAEFVLESLANKKSVIYNGASLSKTQYENRKVQIMSAIIRHIYPHDCGTSTTIDYFIRPDTAMTAQGAVISDNGRDVMLTANNIKNYAGSIVKLYSPITCNHVDGVCYKCGGGIVQQMYRLSNPGMIAGQSVQSEVGQNVLSNRHHTTTSSLAWRMPIQLASLMMTVRNEIMFNTNSTKHLALCVPFSNIRAISDLQYVKDLGTVVDQHFSSIRELMIIDTRHGEILVPPISMVDEFNNTPFLSRELLDYILKNPNKLEHKEDRSVIMLDEFNPNLPVMRSIIKNDSIVMFGARIKSWFTGKAATYSSASLAVSEFIDLVHSKIPDINIVHMQMILKAMLVVNPNDYRIPIVTDPDNIVMSKLANIIPNRQLGTQLIYQAQSTWLKTLGPFTIPRKVGVFDRYLGI